MHAGKLKAPGGVAVLGAATVLILGSAILAAPAAAKAGKKGLGPVVTRTAMATSTVSGPITATARCPGKTQAVGGGFSTSSGLDPTGGLHAVTVYASYRSSRSSWVNNAVAFGVGETLTTHVYCRRVPKPIIAVTAAASTPFGIHQGGTAIARCPGKRRLVAGGFNSTIGPGQADGVSPYASLSHGGGWTYSATNNTDRPQSMVSHAYCAKGVRKPKLVTGSSSQESTLPGGAVPASSVDCSRGRQLSAGGFTATPSNGPSFRVTQNLIRPEAGGAVWNATDINFGAAAGPLSVETQGVCY
jgi:hypothetical protein